MNHFPINLPPVESIGYDRFTSTLQVTLRYARFLGESTTEYLDVHPHEILDLLFEHPADTFETRLRAICDANPVSFATQKLGPAPETLK